VQGRGVGLRPERLRALSTRSSAAISRMRALDRLQPDELAVEIGEDRPTPEVSRPP
jgi:hypothetical protein